jgi:hypothetical protein
MTTIAGKADTKTWCVKIKDKGKWRRNCRKIIGREEEK